MSLVRGCIFTDKKLKPETKIYRTISIERLFQMFEDQTNVVVRPSSWDDTFENLALSSVFYTNGQKGTFAFRDDLYGQCWTLHTASDAMWRIYSKGTDGVRIRTTVKKLFFSLANSNELGRSGETHVGRVKYLSDAGLKEHAEEHFVKLGGVNTQSVASTLLIKRKAFSHEKEVRLIYQSDNKRKEPVLKFSVDAHELIDQIMLHPQLTETAANRLKSRIEKYLGYSGEVKRSLLYAPPKGFAFRI